MKPFIIQRRKIVLDTPYYKVEKQLVEFPDGTTGDWYIKRNNDAVIVIPMNRKGEILLQKTYKHGGGEIITEFCAGLIDEGEDPITAAARELQEETGYTTPNFEKIGEIFASPTSTNMKYHFFIAHDCSKTDSNNLEAAEQIEPFWIKNITETEKTLLHSQPHVSSSTLAAWTLFKAHQHKILDNAYCGGNRHVKTQTQ